MIRLMNHETRVFPLTKLPERKSRNRIHAAGNGSFSTVWRCRLHDCPNLGDDFNDEDYTVPSIPHERKSNRRESDCQRPSWRQRHSPHGPMGNRPLRYNPRSNNDNDGLRRAP